MAITALESVKTVELQSPTVSFQTSEQWHCSLPSIQSQLTTRNLRNLGAALKTLNVLGQTPRASPSPSESSSDSESNHRIHRSTKRVCMREDMNTTREISPRPARPAVIAIPNPFAATTTMWTKPDTPAPWSNPAQSGVQDRADKTTLPPGAPDLIIQLNGLSLPKSPPSSKRDRKTTKNATVERIVVVIARLKPQRHPCGNGVGIRRRSHFALPRPRSLTKRCRRLYRNSSLSSTTPIAKTVSALAERSKNAIVDRTTETDYHPFKTELGESDRTGSTSYDTLKTAATGVSHYSQASIQPSGIAQMMSSDRLRPPRTYVDHVRAQRLPSNAVPSKIPMAAVQEYADSPQQRRMSV
ncbi:uncharacterized protein RCC_04743 [Ramularia collo-cygni]|uniref:Uncharacterized protein n=1 Tax=Ramularia collo-cygni TaxID=112498 RepID=A0A2D3UUM6_9PEZI|nr:uncharacterized protein RCC_04743 [Ramularia collo-cygni]CZT18898.1 uncharacterized protein RCC_04743 [Ramularia collo-cygni]